MLLFEARFFFEGLAAHHMILSLSQMSAFRNHINGQRITYRTLAAGKS